MGDKTEPRLGFAMWRRHAIWLALAGILLRALLPVGWMPNPGGLAHGAPIILCTAEGVRSILIGEDGKPLESGEQSLPAYHDAPCAFAAAVPLSPPSAGITLPAPSIAADAPELPQWQDAFFSLRFSPATPRGPPSLV